MTAPDRSFTPPQPLTAEQVARVDALRCLDKLTLAVRLVRAQDALEAQSESASSDADDARRFRALLIDPEGARHLLHLLQQRKGDEAAFRSMIDRIEASREAARGK